MPKIQNLEKLKQLNSKELAPLLQQASEDLQDLTCFKTAVDQHAIIGITDEKGIITEVNQMFCDISQYSRDELIGQDHRILNSGYHNKKFFTQMWSTIKAGKTWQGTIKNKTKSGEYYWVQTTIHPVKDISGPTKKINQFISIRTDVTDLIELREKAHQLSENLHAERLALNNKNTALNELISNIEKERDRQKIVIGKNFETLITPLLSKLASRFEGVELKYLKLLEENLKEISEPFLPKVFDSRLTPKEIEICNQIKHGLTVKEIAALYHLSPRTIGKHRENIRKKLGLVEQKINLTTYLMSH